MLVALVLVGSSSVTEAQQANPEPDGVISGSVVAGTPGDDLAGGVVVQLLVPQGDGEPLVMSQDLAPDGTFSFEVEADPLLTYLPVARYQGVIYFGNAVLLSEELPTATVGFEVYSTTEDGSTLEIELVSVTVLAIDRAAGELTLIREDLVRQSAPYVYLGDANGVVLRVPVPDGTVAAGGIPAADGEYEFVGGVVVVSESEIRPGVTSVVTQYTVRYDTGEDRYRLRLTTPLAADRIEVRVPERFVREIEPGDEATALADSVDFNGEELLVAERVDAGPGDGLVLDLDGLSGVELSTHPFTSQPGAAIAAAVAALVVAGGVIALARRSSRAG